MVPSLSPVPSKKAGPTIRSSTSPSCSSSSAIHVKKLDAKKSRPSPARRGGSGGSLKSSHREGTRGAGRGEGGRHSMPSPSAIGGHQHHNHHHRGGGGSSTGEGAVVGNGGNSNSRNSPYYSPKGPRSTSSRGSSRHSPKDSTRGFGRGGGGNVNLRGSGRHSAHTSPRSSVYGDADPNLSSPPPRYAVPLSSPHAERVLAVNVNGVSLLVPSPSPSPPHLPYTNVPLPGAGEGLSRSPSPPQSGSQSPAHTLNFEDGRVLSQVPYEYSSLLDFPSSALGMLSLTCVQCLLFLSYLRFLLCSFFVIT